MVNKTKTPSALPMHFKSVAQVDVPQGRNVKHHVVISRIISDLEQLEPGRALKISLSSLTDSKENVRSALNRATRAKGITVATASNEEFFYVWKPNGIGDAK